MLCYFDFFFFKQKTAYEIRISDWSSDVCSSDLSEVEMVLSTQCIMQPKPKKMRITINGSLGRGVLPKDVALFIISKLTTSGATGYFVEYKSEERGVGEEWASTCSSGWSPYH